MILEGGTFERGWGHEGGTPHDGIGALIKRDTADGLCLGCMEA